MSDPYSEAIQAALSKDAPLARLRTLLEARYATEAERVVQATKEAEKQREHLVEVRCRLGLLKSELFSGKQILSALHRKARPRAKLTNLTKRMIETRKRKVINLTMKKVDRRAIHERNKQWRREHSVHKDGVNG